MSKRPIAEAAAMLRQIEGDILVAVLFLPVALAFQELVNGTFGVSEQIDLKLIVDNALLISLILTAWILETLVLGMTVYRSKSFPQVILSCLTLLFVISVTLTSFARSQNGLLFQAVFVISVFAAFVGSLIYYDWNTLMDASEERPGRLIGVMIAIAIPVAVLIASPIDVTYGADTTSRGFRCGNAASTRYAVCASQDRPIDSGGSNVTFDSDLKDTSRTHFTKYLLAFSSEGEFGIHNDRECGAKLDHESSP